MFVFSVTRLLSRRCHKIFSIPQLFSCPSQNRTSGFPTSGSSACHSVCLRSTTWIQVFADSRFRPLYPDKCLVKASPGVRPALALAVEPFEQDSCCAIDVVGTPLRVVRYGVIVQMPDYPAPSYSQHFAFAHYATRPYGPVRKLPQTGPQLLAAGTTLELEVSFPGFATIMGKTQKSELFRLSPALPGTFSGKTTKSAGPIPVFGPIPIGGSVPRFCLLDSLSQRLCCTLAARSGTCGYGLALNALLSVPRRVAYACLFIAET